MATMATMVALVMRILLLKQPMKRRHTGSFSFGITLMIPCPRFERNPRVLDLIGLTGRPG
jgi:hypothetical protein